MNEDNQLGQRRYRAIALYPGATLVNCFATASIVACAFALLSDTFAECALVFAILAALAGLIVYRHLLFPISDAEMQSLEVAARNRRLVGEYLEAPQMRNRLADPVFERRSENVGRREPSRIRVLRRWPQEDSDPAGAWRRCLTASTIDTSLLDHDGPWRAIYRPPRGVPWS